MQRLLLAFLGVAGQAFPQLGQRAPDLPMDSGRHGDRQQDGERHEHGGIRAAPRRRALQKLGLVDGDFETAELELLAAFRPDQFPRDGILIGRAGALRGAGTQRLGAFIMLQHLAVGGDQAGADEIGIAGADAEQAVDRVLVEAPHGVGQRGGLGRGEMIRAGRETLPFLSVELAFQIAENDDGDEHRDGQGREEDFYREGWSHWTALRSQTSPCSVRRRPTRQ